MKVIIKYNTKTTVTGIGLKVTNLLIHPFIDNSGVCENLLNKFDSDRPSEFSIFSEFMEPLFDKICNESNAYAVKQLNNSDRKKIKDDDKWFDTTDTRKTVFKKCVVFAMLGVKGVKLYGSIKSVVLLFN
ncbi:hypothetical protein C0J52_15890 [Blattella germanica]|nr:hypothetical protein C0J52_15890 [Blattella germanica]